MDCEFSGTGLEFELWERRGAWRGRKCSSWESHFCSISYCILVFGVK